MACLRAGNDALPSEIYTRVIEGQPGAAFGAVYTTLSRLAKKKLIVEAKRLDNAGRERRAFTISGSGRQALSNAVNATAIVGGYQVSGGANVGLV